MIAAGSPRELIAQHIEPQVVEVHGPIGGGSLDGAARAAARKRVERAGETVFCYADEVDGLLGDLRRAARARLPAPAGEPGGRVPQADRARPEGLMRGTGAMRWIAVWRRNFLVWRKLLAAVGAHQPRRPADHAVRPGLWPGRAAARRSRACPTSRSSPPASSASATMFTASFESMFSGFSRMHGQKTWDAILYAPLAHRRHRRRRDHLGREQGLAHRLDHPRHRAGLRPRALAARAARRCPPRSSSASRSRPSGSS